MEPVSLIPSLGYDLSASENAARHAIDFAFDQVKKSKNLGLETRAWAAQLDNQIKKLIWVAQHRILKADVPRRIDEINSWQCDIMQVFRSYMNATADTLHRIKALNPPLSGNQIRPFLEAVELDRHSTVSGLEPLAKKMMELASLKNTLQSLLES